MDFPIKNGDFPLLFVCSPEGNPSRMVLTQLLDIYKDLSWKALLITYVDHLARSPWLKDGEGANHRNRREVELTPGFVATGKPSKQ